MAFCDLTVLVCQKAAGYILQDLLQPVSVLLFRFQSGIEQHSITHRILLQKSPGRIGQAARQIRAAINHFVEPAQFVTVQRHTVPYDCFGRKFFAVPDGEGIIPELIREKTGETLDTLGVAGEIIRMELPGSRCGDMLRGPVRNHRKE